MFCDHRSRRDGPGLLAELLKEVWVSTGSVDDNVDRVVIPLSILEPRREPQRLGYHVGVELLNLGSQVRRFPLRPPVKNDGLIVGRTHLPRRKFWCIGQLCGEPKVTHENVCKS